MLIVIGGLPATGKTTLARLLAALVDTAGEEPGDSLGPLVEAILTPGRG